jgi:hypothetical protein
MLLLIDQKVHNHAEIVLININKVFDNNKFNKIFNGLFNLPEKERAAEIQKVLD